MDPATELSALDHALNALAQMDPRPVCTCDRAQILRRSQRRRDVQCARRVPQTVMRGWKLAGAWLTRELRG
jgi:hypothetical protein